MSDVINADREIVFVSEHIKVVYRPGPGDTVIVTFSSFGFRAVGDDFWGASLMDRVDLPALGFVSTQPNWFPPGDMNAALPIALARLAGRRVVTYGHSQGAYGALKYGRALRADRALAFSPQWSIKPAEAQSFDHRYHSYYDPFLKNGEAIKQNELCPHNLVIVDRAEKIDLAHAHILAAMQGVTMVPAPFTGHGTVILIAEGSQGRPLLQRCVETPGIEAQDVRKLIKAARQKSMSYRRTRLEQLQKILPRHQQFYDAALEAMPEGAEKTLAAVLGHVGAARLQTAAIILATLPDDLIAKMNLLRLWPIFREAGFDDGERRIAPLFKRAHADSVFARLHGVGSMAKFGRSKEALAELAALVTLPDAGTCTRFFLEHYTRLERLDLASAFLDRMFESGQLKRSERLRLGLQIAATLRARRKPADADRELLMLQKLCAGDGENLVMLTDVALESGAWGIARDLLASIAGLPGLPPIHLVHKAYMLTQTDLRGARAQLHALSQMPINDLDFWRKLTDLGERLGETKISLKAAEKAFLVSGETFDMRRRLVSVQAANGERRAALRHLKSLLVDPKSAAAIAGRFAEQAAACGDHALAANFAARWLDVAPMEIDALIMACRMFAQCGNLPDARAAMDMFIGRAAQGKQPSFDQFTKALDAARLLGTTEEHCVARLALAAYPGDAAFAAFALPDGGLFSGLPASGIAPKTARRSANGLLARFGFGRPG